MIPHSFRKLGDVVKVDLTCLGDDHSVLQVVVARRVATGISNDIYIENPGRGARGESLGTTFTIDILRIWPLEEQLDELGNLRSFFPPPGWRERRRECAQRASRASSSS